jgi:hypothetical protein
MSDTIERLKARLAYKPKRSTYDLSVNELSAFQDGQESEYLRLHPLHEQLIKLVDAAQSCLWVDNCRCDSAYTARGRHEPNTFCGELDPIREALAGLEEELE